MMPLALLITTLCLSSLIHSMADATEKYVVPGVPTFRDASDEELAGVDTMCRSSLLKPDATVGHGLTCFRAWAETHRRDIRALVNKLEECREQAFIGLGMSRPSLSVVEFCTDERDEIRRWVQNYLTGDVLNVESLIK